MQRNFGIALCVVCLVVGAIRPASAHIDHVVKFVDRLIFKEDDGVVYKWQEIILIKIYSYDKEKYESYRSEVESVFQSLSSITRLQFVFLSPDQYGQAYSIYFHPSKEMNPWMHIRKMPDDWVCDMNPEAIRGHIFSATVRIPTRPKTFRRPSAEKQVSHCISHEIIHSLGLFGHSKSSSQMPSVMEARLRVLTPSCWDKLAVKVLYDKRLAIGRVRKDALPVIREILREYENAGDPCIARHTIGPSIAIGESAVAKYRFVR